MPRWIGCRRVVHDSEEAHRAPFARRRLVLYDLSSSYFEGTTCPLAKLGYSRDGKKGLLQVNYGLRPTDRCAGLPGGGVGARR